jgi:hypothetical protein
LKVLLDACVSPGAQRSLETAGHDVIWAGDWSEDPGARVATVSTLLTVGFSAATAFWKAHVVGWDRTRYRRRSVQGEFVVASITGPWW